MELSNLINTKQQQAVGPKIPTMTVPPTQLQFQQAQQPKQMFPQVQQPQPQLQQQQQQPIKLPSIHEIINISELNYSNPKPQYQYSPPGTNIAPTPYSDYQYQQPQPHSTSSSPFLYSNNNSSYNLTGMNSHTQSQGGYNILRRTSPISNNSAIHSPIESPVYQRSASSTSSLSSSDQLADTSSTSSQQYTNKIGIISRSQNGRKGRSNLPKKTTMILLDWLYKNINHPYPNPKQKSELIYATGLSSQQLSNWFINARRRKIRSLKFQEDEKYIL